MAGDDVLVFRLQGERTFSQAVLEVDGALRRAVEQGARKVLLDVRELSGFAKPGVAARAEMVRRWADTVHGRAKVAMISRREINDAERFDIVLARRLGFDADVFETEAAALEWLHQQPALWAGPPPVF